MYLLAVSSAPYSKGPWHFSVTEPVGLTYCTVWAAIEQRLQHLWERKPPWIAVLSEADLKFPQWMPLALLKLLSDHELPKTFVVSVLQEKIHPYWTVGRGLSITNMTSKQHTIFINDESPYKPERMVRVKLSDIKYGTIFEKHCGVVELIRLHWKHRLLGLNIAKLNIWILKRLKCACLQSLTVR